MHQPPAPLAPFTTGNAKADAAIARLADWELSAYVSFDIDGQRLAKGDFSKIKPVIGD